MPSFLHPKSTDLVDTYSKSFASARPFPYVIIDNFLDSAFANKLVETFPKFKEERAMSELGRVGGKATFENMRDLATPFKELDTYFSSPEFLSWMSKLTGIPDLLYDADYFGGGTHENLNGQDMSVHVDFNYHPTQGWHRRLNALIYLNPEWEESWGGALELWQNPWDEPSKNSIAKISPIFNRLVVFPTTETSWHGFEAVNIPEAKLPAVKGRRSIALYLYTKERPAAETGNMHSTIYYERPLPETIRADKVISKADWKEMRRLTARRDDLLKMIYSREGKFNSVILELTQKVKAQENTLALFQREGKLNELVNELSQKVREQEQLIRQLQSAIPEKSPAEPKPGTPLLFLPSHNGEYVAESGFWNLKHFKAGIKVIASQKFQLKPKTWVLIRNRDTGRLQLVYLAKEFQAFFLAHQPASPGALLVPHDAIYAEVTEVKGAHGERINLPNFLRSRPHALVLAWAFLLLHTCKNLLFGRLRGNWIWCLSVAFRRAFKVFGVHVPVLPPPSARL